MLGRLPSLTLVRLLAALLLATIGLQASQSFDAALRPSHGSAFNAATAEVALAPQRRAETEAVTAAPMPAVLPPAAVAPLHYRAEILTRQPVLRPDSTGPPARLILVRQPAPRAPPAT
ncbi:MAG: hypothetical protein ABIQ81_09095 [Novosphingobium sp.]